MICSNHIKRGWVSKSNGLRFSKFQFPNDAINTLILYLFCTNEFWDNDVVFVGGMKYIDYIKLKDYALF